jgi:hypothetical protein
MRDLKISVVGMFRSKEHGRVFHEHELYTMSVSLLDVSRDSDTAARISVCVAAFSEKHIWPTENERELISLSHSITIVPDE